METVSPAIQDYLKVIYLLGETPRDDDPITVSRVADALGVKAPSASNMLRRLEAMGYVGSGGDRRPLVELTESGLAAALAVVRRHRLLETYLATELGMSWDEVHIEAEILEHHISDRLAERMADALGHPERDPHGDPIPTIDGSVEPVPSVRLNDLEPGDAGTVSRVNDRDSEMLRYLAERGVVPGAVITVVAVEPFGGPLAVRVDGETSSLARDAAREVHIE